jgi:hypothetical protein
MRNKRKDNDRVKLKIEDVGYSELCGKWFWVYNDTLPIDVYVAYNGDGNLMSVVADEVATLIEEILEREGN